VAKHLGPSRGSRREAVLDRALEVASHEGLDGLTIGRLAEDLGLSKSGLFGHFGSREELQLQTLVRASELLRARVVGPALAGQRGTERLQALVDGYLVFLETRTLPGGCLLAAAIPEWDSREGPVGDAVRECFGGWLSLLRDEAQIAGAAEPDALALALLGLVFVVNAAFQATGELKVFRQARSALTFAYRAHGLEP
jgi:AcrR family transcriptional regulator